MSPRRALLLVAVGLAVSSVGLALVRTQRPRPVPRLRVEVLNGCAEPGLAHRAADRLRRWGLEVVDVGNAVGASLDHSVLVDRAGKPRLTRRLARQLGPLPLVLERVAEPGADVTLVLGPDWGSLALFRPDGPALGR